MIEDVLLKRRVRRNGLEEWQTVAAEIRVSGGLKAHDSGVESLSAWEVSRGSLPQPAPCNDPDAEVNQSSADHTRPFEA